MTIHHFWEFSKVCVFIYCAFLVCNRLHHIEMAIMGMRNGG